MPRSRRIAAARASSTPCCGESRVTRGCRPGRCEESDPVRRLAVEKSHPDFLVDRWVARFGMARAADLLDANNRPEADATARLPRPRRPRAAGRGADRRRSARSSRRRSARWASACCAGNPLRDRRLRARRVLRPGRGQPGRRVGAAAVARRADPRCRGGAGRQDLRAPRLGRADGSRRGRRRFAGAHADASCQRAAARISTCRCWSPMPRRRPWARRSTAWSSTCRAAGTGTLRKNPELKWRISESEIGRLSGHALRASRSLGAAGASGRFAGGDYLLARARGERRRGGDASSPAAEGFALVDLTDQVATPLERYVSGLGKWQILPGGDHDGFTVHVLRRLY